MATARYASEQAVLDDEWKLRAGPDGPTLGLSAVFCASGDLIYLFSNAPFGEEISPVSSPPLVVEDLLLFEPLVPLRYTPRGFQTLSASEWGDLAAVTMASYVGMNALSSAQEANVSAGGDQDNFEDSSDSSGLEEDAEGAGDLLPETGVEDLGDCLGSDDMGSAESRRGGP